MAAVTDPILLDSTGQEIVTALETIAENMGTSAGHTIQNDSGTDMQRRDKLQFKGVYVEDDQTNDVTKVNICRQMTKAQMEALSGEELKGFINTTDEPDHLPLTTDWVETDNGDSLTDRISDIEDRIDNIGNIDTIIEPTNSATSSSYTLENYKAILFVLCNSTGKQVYATTIIPKGLISNSIVTSTNVYATTSEADFTFTNSQINLTALANTYSAVYGIK